MKRAARTLRGTRVGLFPLTLVSAISVAVSVLIVVSALNETGPERAIIAALHERRVIRETVPAGGSAPAPTAPAAAVAAVAPTPTPSPIAAAVSDPGQATASNASPATTSSTPSGDGSSNPTASDTADAGGDAAPSGGDSSPASSSPPSKIKHVFVIMLSTPSYAAAFGAGSTARYLNTKLRPRGELLRNYRTLTGAPLPDYIAAVSGQPPNPDTTADCPNYDDFAAGAAPAKNGLVPGSGCVYPNTALTIGDQLDSAALPWRAYIGGMATQCEHPDSGAPETTGSSGSATTPGASGAPTTPVASSPTTTTGYAPVANPFVYFHSLLDLGDCQSDDLPYDRLANSLRPAHHTPSLAFISPDPCDSGAVLTCADGRPGGIAAADTFLRRAVPPILASAAYRTSGMLLVVFTVLPPATGQASAGPVRAGALVLSPYAKRGSIDGRSYNPYSLLRSVERVFGQAPLGRAKTAKAFGPAATA